MSADNSQSSRWSRTVAILCVCAAACSGATLLAFFVRPEFSPSFSLEDWVRVGGLTPFHVELEFAFSPFALLLFCSNAIVLGVASHRSDQLTCVAIIGCLLSAFVMLFGTNLVLWFVGWLLAAFCVAVIMGIENRTAAPLAAKRFLTASVLLDGMFLVLVATLLNEGFRWEWEWGFGAISMHAVQPASDEGAATFAQVVAFYIPVSLLARLGVFPFHGWSGELSAARWQTVAVARCGLFACPALLLMLRYIGMTDEPNLIVTLGTLTILLGGTSSLLRANPLSALNGVMTATIGLVFILSTYTLLIGFLAVFMPIFVAAMIGLQNASSDVPVTEDQTLAAGEIRLASVSKLPVWLLLIAFVYATGRFIDRGFEFGGLAVFLIGLIGLLAGAVAIVRSLFIPIQSSTDWDDRNTWRIVGLTTFSIVVTTGILVQPDFFGRTAAPIIVNDMNESALSLADPIVLGLALTIGFTLFRRPSDLPGKIVKGLGPIGRLAKQGFYLDDAVFFLLTMPLRGLAQVARLMDWLVVDNMVVGVPSKYPAWIAKIAAPLRQPSPGLSLLSTSVGLGVMLVIVVWLWS